MARGRCGGNGHLSGPPPEATTDGGRTTPLASRAEVAAPAADDQALNGLPAPVATLARSLINAESGPVIAALSLDVDIIAETGTLELDRAVEDIFHSPQEATGDDRPKPPGRRQRMDLGLE